MNYFDMMCEMTGYEGKTTFWSDFTIADAFGKDAIKDTYKRALEWRSNVEYYTELVMVLNWKSWEQYELSNTELSSLYVDLFYEAQNWGYDYYKGNDLDYFIHTLD